MTEFGAELDEPAAASSHEFVIDSFRQAGYAIAFVKVCPMNMGIPQTRGRVFYMATHVDKYSKAVGLTGVFKMREAHCQEQLNSCIRLAQDLPARLSPKLLPVEAFLLPRGHRLCVSKVDQMEAAAEDAKPKRARPDFKWMQLHEAFYGKAGMKWVDPKKNPLSRNYAGNPWYESLGPRERDIIFFWDAKQPFQGGAEELIDLCLCFAVSISASRCRDAHCLRPRASASLRRASAVGSP